GEVLGDRDLRAGLQVEAEDDVVVDLGVAVLPLPRVAAEVAHLQVAEGVLRIEAVRRLRHRLQHVQLLRQAREIAEGGIARAVGEERVALERGEIDRAAGSRLVGLALQFVEISHAAFPPLPSCRKDIAGSSPAAMAARRAVDYLRSAASAAKAAARSRTRLASPISATRPQRSSASRGCALSPAAAR